jgi:peptidoglycan/xylan/chitin deacetylase (PgdA/CDA1 family)
MTGIPFVLMYHSIEPYTSDPFQVTVRPDRFERQLRWLRDRGLRGVSMRELLAARRAGRGAGLVGLTFDDGYTDFVTHAMPALARHGFTATVFVIAGVLGGHNAWDQPGPRKTLMTADEVRRAAAAGVEIGSHSLTHARLTDVDGATLAAEVGESRAALAGLTGSDVDGFCYPYGAVAAREVDAVRAAGYGYACAVYRSTLDGPHAIPRTFVGDRDTSPRLHAKRLRHRLHHELRPARQHRMLIRRGGAE